MYSLLLYEIVAQISINRLRKFKKYLGLTLDNRLGKACGDCGGNMNFFKPEDFFELRSVPSYTSDMAKIANAKLEREGVVVYGAQYPIESKEWNYQPRQAKGHTHKALLINIEPIKQETCADAVLKAQWNGRTSASNTPVECCPFCRGINPADKMVHCYREEALGHKEDCIVNRAALEREK